MSDNHHDHTRHYKAFISYAHKDKAAATRLHIKLENFRTPKKIIGTKGRFGSVAPKLTPIFRDRDELSTGSALGPELQRALDNSEFLIVLCSPASAQSHWVNEEIRYFRKSHGDERILAAIVDGDPAAPVGEGEEGCFPPALIEPPEEGAPPREPIAADMREEGDGKRLAFQKLASGMLGVGLDALVQRLEQRRQRRLTQIAAASLAGMAMTSGLAVYAYFQRDAAIEQRAIAETERDTATASLDFLVSIFEIANPATENPKTITALTILERGREKIETELKDRPQVQAKLMSTMGKVYFNLGDAQEAKTLYERSLENPSINIHDEIETRIALADTLNRLRDLDAASLQLSENKQVIDQAHIAGELSPSDTRIHQTNLLRSQASVKLSNRNDEDAISLLEDAKRNAVLLGHEYREGLADIHMQLGRLYSAKRRTKEGESELQAARKVYVDIYGDDHIRIAETDHALAFMYFYAEDYTQAKQAMENASVVYGRLLENGHPVRATAAMFMGRIRQAQGDNADAVENFKESLAQTKTLYGEKHQRVGFRLLFLSQAQADAGQYENALESLDEAQIIYDENFAADDFNQGDIMIYRGVVLKKAGQAAEAEKLCEKGLAIMAQTMPPDDAYLIEWTEKCAA